MIEQENFSNYLLEEKIIEDKIQLKNSILYINNNSVKHKLVNNCLDYLYSSVHDIIAGNTIFVESDKVFKIFGDIENFKKSLTK